MQYPVLLIQSGTTGPNATLELRCGNVLSTDGLVNSAAFRADNQKRWLAFEFVNSCIMETKTQVASLSTLGHDGRLEVFRLLARRAPRGACPGELAESTGLKPSTLFSYLSSLSKAGLIESSRHGKSIQYNVNLSSFGAMIDYLVADCFNERLDIGRAVQGGH